MEKTTNIDLLERELYLKQLQIKSLLYITQSINKNVSAENLFKIYKDTLNWELGIPRMALFFREDKTWTCKSHIEAKEELLNADMNGYIKNYSRISLLEEDKPVFLDDYDIVVPVFHKEIPIAITFIGGLNDNDDIYEKIEFVSTITSIISVAIENKRLFKRQLEQERLKHEMTLAASMQNMLIPTSLPKNDHYKFHGVYKPHLGVGGDYFDFVDVGRGVVAFCVADISGKGVAAALLMSNFQAHVQAIVRRNLPMGKLIRILNKRVLEITKGDKFITFFIGKYNVETRKLQYVNAGHTRPILLMNGCKYRLDEGCTILGVFDKLPDIEVGEISIEENAMLVAYTDGLTDLTNENGDYFNVNMLEKFIDDNRDMEVEQLNEKLLKHIDKFKGEREYPDDVAVLTCKLY